MPIRITGLNSGLDTEAIIQELVSAKSYKKTQLEKAQTKLGWKQEAWKALNTKIYDFYTKTLDNFRFETSFQKKKTVCSNANAASVTASELAPYSTQTLAVNKIAQAGYMTGAQLGGGTSEYKSDTKLSELGITDATSITVTVGGEEKTINLGPATTIGGVINELSKAGVGVNFDLDNQRIYVNSKETGADANFTFGGDADALAALGLSEAAGAKKIEGQDAEIELNGVTYSAKSNVFSINGLTITAHEVTTSDATITTTTDTSGIYDMVKDFFKGYNELVNEMDKLYNADAAKGYEPLTDEEKDELSETEIEKWEDKIKDSLLRRDSTLSGVASAMREVMSSGVTMKDGSKKYLFDFGINTLGYFSSADNEKNAYHIDGDPDNSNTSGEEDKLSALIASDPEMVTEFFTSLAKNLYGTLSKKLARIDNVSSALTVYNDQTLQKEYDAYTKKIKTQQDKVDDYMDRYYAKFAAMETALATLNSKQNAVSQLLGM